MTTESNTLFVLTGPTGVGKTQLSLDIAQRLNSPIINADSRQIYRHMPIGTASPTITQRALAKHYFVDQLELDQYYSAAEYESEVMKLLPQLFQATSNLLLTGGSMLYIDAVCNGIDDIPTVDPQTRATLKQRLHNEGLESLCEELKRLDPTHYNRVDLHNHKRVIHALEICLMTGKPYSSFLKQKPKERPFRIVKIGLNRPRDILFERINKRVDQMMNDGLEQEALQLYPLRHLNSLNTVGYKELFTYFDGEWDLDTAIEKIKRNTRVYAKKQLTWYKKDPSMIWFDAENPRAVIDYIDSVKSK